MPEKKAVEKRKLVHTVELVVINEDVFSGNVKTPTLCSVAVDRK